MGKHVDPSSTPNWYTGDPLVCCRGGPYPNSWEFLARWLSYRAGDGTPGSVGSYHRCGYLPTGRTSGHPFHKAIRGCSLIWEPTLAAAMTDEEWIERLPRAVREVLKGS